MKLATIQDGTRDGKLVVVKDGRFGPYIEETEPEAAAVVDPETGEVLETAPAEPAPAAKGKKSTAKSAAPKNRTASLFRSMSVDTIDLETALRLLDLPRVVGEDPASGEQITAQNGRFGPYLKKGTDSRSLESEAQIFDITLENGEKVATHILSLTPFRRIVKDYFMICDSYYEAIRSATPFVQCPARCTRGLTCSLRPSGSASLVPHFPEVSRK